MAIDTAYAKNPIDKEWYNLDDSYASKTNEASIMVMIFFKIILDKCSLLALL